MGQKEKLIKRLKTKPRDFTFDEAETLLGYLTYSRSNKGKTSGSRVMFTSEQHAPILLHKRALDVCSAKVNADIVHGTVLPTGKIFSRIIPAAARNCKGSAALADGFFELFQRPLFDAGDIAS